VTGEFAYASDLWHDDMVWGVTLRSPHPHARIAGIDITDVGLTGVTASIDPQPHELGVGVEGADY